MDSAGNNRYELLFMDDDVSDPFENVVSKKKQAKNAAAASGAPPNKSSTNKASTTKKQNQSEKENKPLNKNELNNKKINNTTTTTTTTTTTNNNNNNGNNANNNAGNNATERFNNKQQGGAGVVAGGANANNRKRNNGETREGGQGQQRNVNFRQQNGETREYNNNRRNVRENGTFNASTTGGDQQQQPQRQFRDRDNRGPPRNRNFEGGNRKREFDRQSGSDKTGVKAIDKRDGAGAHNWGSVKEAIDDVNNKDIDATEKSDDNAHADQSITEPTPIEEETKELTLDEWKAQQQQRVKPTFNIRKAGEGEDTSQWKKMVVLNKNKKKENESEEELEFDPAMYPQRVGRQQRLLDIQFNFNDGRRGGFGNRGRGRRQTGGNENNTKDTTNVAASSGGAGGSGVGGGVGGRRFEGGRPGGKRNFNNDRQQNIAPKVNDESQFPTLG